MNTTMETSVIFVHTSSSPYFCNAGFRFKNNDMTMARAKASIQVTNPTALSRNSNTACINCCSLNLDKLDAGYSPKCLVIHVREVSIVPFLQLRTLPTSSVSSGTVQLSTPEYSILTCVVLLLSSPFPPTNLAG